MTNTYGTDNKRLTELHTKHLQDGKNILGYMVQHNDYENERFQETLYAVSFDGSMKKSATVDCPNTSFNVSGWTPCDEVPPKAEFIGMYKAV